MYSLESLIYQQALKTWRGFASLSRNQKVKVGSCESGELFFTCAFLFAASVSCEGGEKRTTAKNKRP
jgi:hypothetical protein